MAAQTLDGIDPMFVALCKSVYGDLLDPRELWAIAKSMPDSSGVSTHGGDKKKALAGGLLLGTAAETSATAAAAKHAFPRAGTAAAKATKPLAEKLAPLAAKIPKLPGGAGGKAHFALQATNLGVGMAAAHELLKKPKSGEVAKAKLPRVNPAVLVRSNARARRSGLRLAGGTIAAGSAAGGYAVGRHDPVPALKSKLTRTGVAKSVDLEFRGEISKLDTDKRQAFGWANVAIVDGQMVEDVQGDYVSIDEIEKSAYAFMLNSRKGGHQHQRIGKGIDLGPLHVADVIESFVVTPEKLEAMGLAPDALPLGWWNGMQVHDDGVWDDVKSGRLTGFSIHGTGVRKDMVIA